MGNIKVSVIMPVYKVEDYVGRAIESIQAQTLTDWEFFAVDDGSPDKSGAICDEYAAKDERIHVIHQKNGGAPAARNAAIDLAKGDYLYFLDADDWAEPTMLEDMVNLAEKNDSQLVVAGYYIDTYYSDTEKFTQEQVYGDRVFASQREFREHAHELFDRNLLYTPWNKLYSGKYIRENNLRFPGTFWDDFPFNLSVVYNVERVCVTSGKYYHFLRQRAESETAKYRGDMYEKREEENGWMKELYKLWDVSSPESKEFIARRYVERIIGCIENVTNDSCTLSPKEKKAEIKKMINTAEVDEALALAQPRSAYMKVLIATLKSKCVTALYLQCRFISKVKSGNVKTFAKLKANR